MTKKTFRRPNGQKLPLAAAIGLVKRAAAKLPSLPAKQLPEFTKKEDLPK